jgi:hypothetical protein
VNHPIQREPDPRVFGVLHLTGQGWSVLAARTGESGQPTIIAAELFPPGRSGEIEPWLERHNVGEVICVLPAASVICRTCSLPDAPLEQLMPALRLQAEAHLLGIAPPHRLAMAVLDQAAGETSRTGLVLAWPPSAKVEPPPVSSRRHVSYVPDVACLAALLNGLRPAEPLMWVDRVSGSLALALTHASGAVFRSLREDAEDTAEWRAGVGRVLAETALNAGHGGAFVEDLVRRTTERLASTGQDPSVLLMPAEMLAVTAERLGEQSSPHDGEWWSRFGVAAGAVIARSVGGLTSLTRMRADAPAEQPSLVRKVTEALSNPATARRVVIAALLLLLLGPPALSALRLAVLSLRYPDDKLKSQLRQVHETSSRLIVYGELERTTWSATKILADISCNTPEGIELESIRINQGMFTVQGRALPRDGISARELVALMQKQLHDSGIFDNLTLNWGDADSYDHYQFQLTARIRNPYHRPTYGVEQDFGQWTVVHRRDGVRPEAAASSASAAAGRVSIPSADKPDHVDEVALADAGLHAGSTRNDAAPDRVANDEAAAGRAERGESIVRSPRTPPGAGNGASPIYGDAGRRDERGPTGLAPSVDIPPPLTESQVQALTDAEVMEMLGQVSRARNAARTRGDAELAERLKRDFDMLMDRRRGADAAAKGGA